MRAAVTVLLSLASVGGLICAAQAPAVSTPADYSPLPRIQAGRKISPVPMNLIGKNRQQVFLGSYLVNAQGACSDCHTFPPFEPGGDPFQDQDEKVNTAHFLGGGTPFGPFVSKNITPDVNGNPAGLTRQEFIQKLRTGLTDSHPAFGPFLQVMPWPGFGGMRDEDISAIYEYLRSIPHAEPGP